MLQESLDLNSADSELVAEYEVEKILSRMASPQGMLYLIKWKGYPKEEDFTWEPLQHLLAVKELVEQFNKQEDQKQKRKQRQNYELNIRNLQKIKTKIIDQKQQEIQNQTSKVAKQKKNQIMKGKISKFNEKQKKQGKQQKQRRQKKRNIEKQSNKVESKHKIIHKISQRTKQTYKNRQYSKQTIFNNKIFQFKSTQFSSQVIDKVSHNQEKLQLGHINSHLMKQKELFLDVSFVDQNKITKKCKLLNVKEIDKRYSQTVQKYLEYNLEFMLKMQLQINLHLSSLK